MGVMRRNGNRATHSRANAPAHTYGLFKTQRERNKTNSPQPQGGWIECKTPIGTYFCTQPHRELRSSTCPKTVSAKQAETQVREEISEFITEPADLASLADRSPTSRDPAVDASQLARGLGDFLRGGISYSDPGCHCHWSGCSILVRGSDRLP